MTIKTFQEAEAYLANQLAAPSHRGEERLVYVRSILDTLGHPQDAVPAIHIAGTSGKGSTAYYASQLLYASGYRVGTVVSPHVSCIAERTQINGALLSEVKYCRYFTMFLDRLNVHGFRLTYVEFMVVFAYWLFAEIKVDYMVIEVGVGGRLDTTNVMSRKDKVAVITDIGFDHTELLGDTLAKIAYEKSGIITANASVVMHRQAQEIMEVIAGVARQQDAVLYELDDVLHQTSRETSLPSYQVRNSQLAIASVNRRLAVDECPPLTSAAIFQARNCMVPGRFERVDYEGVTVILDVAHNPQKMSALAAAFHDNFADKTCLVVTAFGANKLATVAESMRVLASVSCYAIATEFTVEGMDRAAIPVEKLSAIAEEAGLDIVDTDPSPAIALRQAIKWARRHDAVMLITGSFYLISEMRAVLGIR